MKIKSSFISTLEFRSMHPKGVIAASDMYFASLANKIFRTLLNDKIFKHEFNEDLLRQLALKSSSYLEDTVSQWGLFDGFRKLNSEICGNLLPFYTLDEEYYREEINIEDVQFLVWSTFQENLNEKGEVCFLNPDNPMLMIVSSVIYDILDDVYETAPENEIIQELLHEYDYEDFHSFRNLLEWMCYNSYLSTNNAKNSVERLKESILKMSMEDREYSKYLDYLVASNAIFFYACTPLAVKAIDWFRSISTNSRMLERAVNMSFRPLQLYKIVGSNDSFINLESFFNDKIKISLSRQSINPSDANQTRKFSKGNEIVRASLVFFDGVWNINGGAIFMEMQDEIKNEEECRMEEKKRLEKNILYTYNELFKYNKNIPIAFFKNSSEFAEFWNKAFSDDTNMDDFIKSNRLKNENNLVTFFSPKNGAFTLPKIAECIKYPANKLYNANAVHNEGLALLTGGFPAPLEFLEFIINNNYIPDAKINSLQSTQRGKEIVQDNKWFIVRFFQSELFHENIFDLLT